MRLDSSRLLRISALAALLVLALAAAPAVLAQTDLPPTRVTGLEYEPPPLPDISLSWDPVTVDVGGNPETVDYYKIYRGETPDFVPDKAGGSNLIGTSTTESYLDLGAMTGVDDYFYIVSAVDTGGNESNTKDAVISTLPLLDGSWTKITIILNWTPAGPPEDVVSYRLYYGRASGEYEFVEDMGLSTSQTLVGLEQLIPWYFAVTAVDVHGNETPFSNEYVEAVNGTVKIRVHDEEELCWGADTCTPTDPEKIQRANGWQLMVPVTFPEGDWTKVTVEFTVDSRLCVPPAQGTVTKCGSGNPCVSPPCNGGYNPCGDPWDRAAHLFMVLDDCIETGANCMTTNNLELIRAVTPFGSDAPAPDGSGIVAPMVYEMDITPYAPLLVGTRHIGAHIGHYVQKGWWVSVDFTFTKRLDWASPTPPADGIEIVGWANAPLATKQVTVPLTATDVNMRLFTTGHGGGLYCDGGTNDANSCESSADCPNGVCNPCDEFCHRMNQIIVDGTPVWEVEPWRTDCSPSPPFCSEWNACGYPSCTYPRAGWCPGYIACHSDPPCDNDIDFTLDLPPGGTYDIDYNVTPKNGSWPVSLVMYWYE